MTPKPVSRYRITVIETRPDGTTKERIAGTCSAYVLAISEDRDGELRVLTDHDGPIQQRRIAVTSLTEHVKATIGLGR